MRNAVALFAAVVFLCAQAHADVVMSLHSPDLAGLTVGQTMTVTVHLCGLPSGASLGMAAAEATYDPALLGSPAVSAGSIVPQASDTFLGDSYPDLAGGSFDSGDLSASSISRGGVFFSFTVPVLAPGTGTIDLSFVSIFDSEGNPLDVVAGRPLTFEANPAPAVPLPSAFASFVVLFAGVRGMTWLRRRGRCRA